MLNFASREKKNLGDVWEELTYSRGYIKSKWMRAGVVAQ
jgi:hypothetical protein